ncbi:hypothetical protein SeMB42_g00180 [Synchytrium endobioticum]|uniref:J domain-containing protein n=1 Tax=Synchytrium endobioticum TaxID=286115 RepID=A0A507DTR2_9FUNG|nr:hypothetical protein SeMB42_g00180 [Synchytrium endobioticum]
MPPNTAAAPSTLTVRECYELLQVQADCTDEELKVAYKKQALICHPDKRPNDPEATSQFQKLQEAKEIIESHRNGTDGPRFEFDMDEFLFFMLATGALRYATPRQTRSAFRNLSTPQSRQSSRSYDTYYEDPFDEDDEDDEWSDEENEGGFADNLDASEVEETCHTNARSNGAGNNLKFTPPPSEFHGSPRSPECQPYLKRSTLDEKLRESESAKREEDQRRVQEKAHRKTEEKQRKEENKRKAADEARRKKEETERLAKEKAEEERLKQEQQTRRSWAFQAARGNNLQELQEALAAGVSAEGSEFLDKKLRHPAEPLIHQAARSNLPEMLELVCAHGGRVDEADSKGRQSLTIAVLSNAFDSADWLLKKGASPSSLDGQNKTALGHAAERGLIAYFDLMMQHGATHNVPHGHKELLEDYIKERLDMTVPPKGVKMLTAIERADLLVIYGKLLSLSGKALPKEYGGDAFEEDPRPRKTLMVTKKSKVDMEAAKKVQEKLKKEEEARLEEVKRLEALKASQDAGPSAEAKPKRKKKSFGKSAISASTSRLNGIHSHNTDSPTTVPDIGTHIDTPPVIVGASARIPLPRKNEPADVASSKSQPTRPVKDDDADSLKATSQALPQHHKVAASQKISARSTVLNTAFPNGDLGSLRRNTRRKKSSATFESPTQPVRADPELEGLTAQIVDMGFDPEVAHILLEKNKCDVSMTIDQLTSDSYDKSYVRSHMIVPQTNDAMKEQGLKHVPAHIGGYDDKGHDSSIRHPEVATSVSEQECAPNDANVSYYADTSSTRASSVREQTNGVNDLQARDGDRHGFRRHDYTEHIPQAELQGPQMPSVLQYQTQIPSQQHHYSPVSGTAGYSLFSQPGFLVQPIDPAASPYTTNTTYKGQPVFYHPQIISSAFDLPGGAMFTDYQYGNGPPQAMPYTTLHSTSPANASGAHYLYTATPADGSMASYSRNVDSSDNKASSDIYNADQAPAASAAVLPTSDTSDPATVDAEIYEYEDYNQPPSPPKQTRQRSPTKNAPDNCFSRSRTPPNVSYGKAGSRVSRSFPYKYRTSVCRHYQRGHCSLGGADVQDEKQLDSDIKDRLQAELDQEVQSAARTRRLVVLSFVIYFLLGIPVWWKTTEIYRAPLPFDVISSWSQPDALDTTYVLRTNLIAYPAVKLDPSQASTIANSLNYVFTTNSVNQSTTSHTREGRLTIVQLQFTTSIHHTASSDKYHDLIHNDSENTHMDYEPGLYNLHVTCSATEQYQVYVGERRSIYADIAISDCAKSERVVDFSVRLIAGIFAGEQKALKKVFRDKNKNILNEDHDSMRVVKFADEYQLVLSLFNGNPADAMLSWDVAGAVNAYLQSFLNRVSKVSRFAVSSQVQHYAELPITPERHQTGNETWFAIETASLKHFINSAEWNLASFVSSSPPLNFILYVPEAAVCPLHILKSNGQKLSTNAFLIHQWGGIAITNAIHSAHDRHPRRVHLRIADLKPFFEIVVAQMRRLIGVVPDAIAVDDVVPSDTRITYAASGHGITLLELDRLVRKRTLQCAVDAISTLRSLATLVADMGNMEVRDEIRGMAEGALSALDEVKRGIADNRIDDSLKAARRATVLAEEAFFHPTMVSLLYFPSEHRYAILTPLFVPISVPLIAVIFKEARAWATARRLWKSKAKME